MLRILRILALLPFFLGSFFVVAYFSHDAVGIYPSWQPFIMLAWIALPIGILIVAVRLSPSINEPKALSTLTYDFLGIIERFMSICLGFVLLFWIGIGAHSHFSDALRYRITVAVETPEGIRTGSAVREVIWSGAQKFEGEAAVVDLGKRGVLFALPDSNSGYGVSYGVLCNIPEFREHKTLVGTKWTLLPGDYPKLVTFTDLKDPLTMKTLLEIQSNGHCGKSGKSSIQADHFEEHFGQGVKLKEITLEKTNDTVTKDLEKWLPWIPCLAQTGTFPSGMAKTLNLSDARRQHLNSLSFKGLSWRARKGQDVDCASFWEYQAALDNPPSHEIEVK